MNHYLSVITTIKPDTLTKTYSLAGDGELEMQTVGNMSEGSISVKYVADAGELAQLIGTLGHNQALCFGRTEQESIGLLSSKKFQEFGEPVGYVTRTLKNFSYPIAAGVMVLDYDPKAATTPLTKIEWLSALYEACAALKEAGAVYWVSSSSNIYEGDRPRKGVSGQRLWVLVTDASDIKRAGKALAQRLWLNGHGYFDISRSARLLDRNIIDESVWNANGLDFASGANCIAPLNQRRGEPDVFVGAALDTATAIPDLNHEETEKLIKIKAGYKDDLKPALDTAKTEYVTAAIERLGLDDGDAIYRALDDSILSGEMEIQLSDGRLVTVGKVLDNPSDYHGLTTLDPLEPEYDNFKTVGKLFLIGGRPVLHSFAHGGQTFKLIRQVSNIELAGGRTFEAVNNTVELLKQMPDVFDMAEVLVTVGGGKTVSLLSRAALSYFLGGLVQYYRMTPNRQGVMVTVLVDPSAPLVDQITALRTMRNLKALQAVITAPILRADGSVLDRVGYDAQSQLYLDSAEQLFPVPVSPTDEQVQQALIDVMYPFKDFPFATPLDKGIMLAGILTAVMRPTLDTAPAFGFDAPVQGSGKSLLAMCLAVLASGETPDVWPHVTNNEEEVRKRLTTALKDGARSIIWDNILGVFDSASIAGLLTSPVFSDRVLGQSEKVTMPNKMLFLMTGNNMVLAGDMPRRVLKCRIDPVSDRPFAREFKLDPLQYVKDNRQMMVSAALTIIRGYLSDIFGERAAGRMASFELWDDLVRQPVAWVNREVCAGEYSDPMEAVEAAQATDPEQEVLSDLLEAAHGEFGGEPFTAKELLAKSYPEYNGSGFADDSSTPLFEALTELCSNTKLTARSIGKQLAYRKDRIVGGKRLVEAGEVAKTKRYKVAVM